MFFAPDTTYTLDFLAAFVNTAPGASRSGEEELATPAQLTALVKAYGYSGRFDRDLDELHEVLETRGRLRRIWTLSREDMVAEVNAMLREANAVTQLAKHDDLDWHLHATAADAPLAERMRVEASLALADVIRTDSTDRLRTCAADDCEGVLIDMSKNGSKRFCSVRCGNRMNMIAFRERRAEEESG